MTLEATIRPFQSPETTATPFHPENGTSAPPVRLQVGIKGGTKTFSWSGASSISTYMAAVHTEKPSSVFDMTTGKLSGQ